MKKPLWLLLCVFIVELATSQSLKTCSKENVLDEDLNSISKCKFIKKNAKGDKTSRQLVLKFNSTKGRYLRKRKKEIAKVIDELNGRGLAKKQEAVFSESLKVNKIEKKIYQLQDVDYIPLFKSCENVAENQKLNCFNLEIGSYIQENFEYPEEAIEDEITGKVTVNFIISEEGKIINIEAEDGTNEENVLTKYSKSLIANLPALKPALKKNRQVSISYELQLDFSLE